MKYTVEYSRTAIRDLDRLWEDVFSASRSFEIAETYVDDLMNKIEDRSDFPSSGESGEAIDLVKKHLAQGHPLEREALAKELGDVAWYLAETAHAIGYDLETILSMNIEKLRARYPEGFNPQASINRNEQ